MLVPGNKVLMTGYNGFTGRYMSAALRERGYVVHGLVRNESSSPCEHKVDLRDYENLLQILIKIKPDYCIHLAGISYVAHANISDFYNINLLGTLNLLEAVNESKCVLKKILISSSANVYGNPKKDFLDEDTESSPMNHYACSKLAMENMVRLWFDRFPIVIARPFNYTGPGQSLNFLVPKIVNHFKQKKSVIALGNLDVIRDISDVEYVVKSYITLLESNVQSDVINICSGVGYKLQSIIEMVEEIAGYKIAVEVCTSLVRDNEIKVLIGSNEKFNQLVGKIETKPLIETLKRMYLN